MMPSLACLVAALLIAAAAPPAEARAQPHKLLGTWTLVEIEHDGDAVELSGFQGSQVVFEPGKCTVWFGSVRHAGGFALSLTRQQNGIIDLDCGGSLVRGIYGFAGDKLTVCVNQSNSKRPTAFATTPKNGWVLFTLRRGTMKDVLPQFAAQLAKEQQQLRGRWKVVAAAPAGKGADAEMKKEWLFNGNWVTITGPGRDVPWAETVHKGNQVVIVKHPANETRSYRDPVCIDPTADPKRISILIDLIDDDPILGIYSLEGNVLKLRIRADGKDERPADFTSELDDGVMELTLERMGKK
jgi:uncharacterized protein (TIGR03067 family)